MRATPQYPVCLCIFKDLFWGEGQAGENSPKKVDVSSGSSEHVELKKMEMVSCRLLALAKNTIIL